MRRGCVWLSGGPWMGARALAAARWVIGLSLALVAGCTTFGDTFHVTAFLHEQITGDTWRACLAREYQTQTRTTVRNGRDWAAASRFSAKGWATLTNGDVAPWPVSAFDLSVGRQVEFEK